MSRTKNLILLASLALGAHGFAQEATSQEAPAPDNGASAESTAATAVDTTPATKAELQGAIAQILNVDDYYNRKLQFELPVVNRPLTISGTVQTRFTYLDDHKTPYSFSIPLTSLSFSGILYKDFEEGKNLTYNFGFSSSNAAAPTVAEGSIGYTLVSSAVDPESSTLTFTAGQTKKPFGLEPQSTDEVQPAINGSLFLGAGAFNDVSARDIGAVAKADFFPTVDNGYNYRAPLLSVAAGIFNGSGPATTAASDNNKDKAWVVRAALLPPVDYYNILRGLQIGVSFSKDEKLLTATGVTTPATTVTVRGTGKDSTKIFTYTTVASKSTIDTIQGDRTRLGLDISYIRTPVNFAAEAIYGTQDSVYFDATSKTFKSAHLQNFGGSATFFLNFGDQYLKQTRNVSRPDDYWPVTWQPFFRADYYDPDINVDNNWQGALTLGANLFFARTTKLQVNWRKRLYEVNDYTIDEYYAQLQYGF